MSIDQAFQEKLRQYYKKEGQDVKIIYLKLQNSGYIARFRDTWGLPADGFLNSNNYYKWRREFLNKRTSTYLRSKEYKNMGAIMKAKKFQYARGKISYFDIDDYGWTMRLSEPLFKFEWDIDTIITKLGIPERYKAFSEQALMIRIPPDWFMIDKDRPKPVLITDPDTGRKKVIIETYGDTTLKDFRDKVFAYEFKKLQKEVYDCGTIKKLGVYNLEMFEQFFKWRNEGKLLREIRQLAQAKYGYFIKNDENLKVYLKRFKRLGGTRKRKV